MTDLQVTVHKKTLEAEGIFSFDLVSADGLPLPPFTAGAHIDVHAGPGLIRQYSLCNHPGETERYQIAVLRDPASRGGAIALHDTFEVGHEITIGAPRTHFPLVPARQTLLIAGGIGVTPLLCMAEALADAGADFAFHYSARNPARAAFRARLAESDFAERVFFHYDDGEPAQKLDLPALLAGPDGGRHLYVCGPVGFIDHVLGTARDAGWAAAQLHTEYFAAQAVDTSHDGSFTVRIASSGKEYQVPPEVSVATILLRHGVALSMSCEQGVCGSCITGVLEGEPDHRDLCLTDEERERNDQFTPCCSRAKGKLLVLDL